MKITANYLLTAGLVTGNLVLADSPKNSGKENRPNILFCIADDAAFAHFSANGSKWVKTPAYDYVAANGINFINTYTSNAKSAPSRASVLTGRHSWQLEEIGNHISIWPSAKYTTFMEVLGNNNYRVGYTGKGWAPGNPGIVNGKERELTGKKYNAIRTTPPSKQIANVDYAANFEAFLNSNKEGNPWSFWFGCHEPHRPYEYGTGAGIGGMKMSDIDNLPSYWPDNDTVRMDMLDYAFEIEYLDKQLDKMINMLTKRGELDNTIIIVTSDNGMPFPRSKGLQYESSNHMPFAVMWPKGINEKGRTEEGYVNFVDIAPTLIEAAGLKWQETGMEPSPGKSLMDVFKNQEKHDRSYTILGQERHDAGRPANQGYPIRSIIMDGFLYSFHFKPELWPAGDPETGYLNTDGSPTKSNILNLRRQGIDSQYWKLNFGKLPQEHLYHISVDRHCLINLADQPAYNERRKKMKKILFDELKSQNDPRLTDNGDVFDRYPFFNELYHNLYEKYMKGDKSIKTKTGWVNPTDYEEEPLR
ncbi:MAG: sulfatase [Paludibacter sp.]|jgi:arylsulfatase A-like enzyme|nr:sulfatase [Paludibacter sp.]